MLQAENVFYYEETDSTNTRAKEYAKSGGEAGSVFLAKSQTKGRGRHGRTWVSPNEGNLYFSILLRPNISAQEASMLTLIMGYAISLAIEEETGVLTQIKWPNDLVIAGKKVCGILTEMSAKTQSVEYVIIGAGINIGMESVAPEIQGMATSLKLEGMKSANAEKYTDKEEQIQSNANKQVEIEMSIQKLLACILQKFQEQYEIFLEDRDLRNIYKGYNDRLVNVGREVIILDGANEYTAKAEGINQQGELFIEKQDGVREAIRSGEVSVRGVYGYV
jgi:birA, biotin-[acetyl-CoA-carboxylase] ligase region